MYDTIIEGALVLDGSGADPRVTSVALKGDRVAAVCDAPGEARERIDARGLALMPGIIDGHTHYDAQLTWDALADPSLELGVTTVVIGNCGFTIAPCRHTDRDLMMRNLTQVEGMSLDALRSGIRWDFETVGQYFDALQKKGVGPNVVGFVGHSAVRTFVMGEEASERPATDAEIAQMAALVDDAMRHGAVGFSTSTHESHNGDGGRPMPSRLAEQKEFRALVEAMGARGTGLIMITKGQDTRMEDLEELSAAATRPILIAPINHNPANPEKSIQDLAYIRAARERGNLLYAQVSCLPLTFDFSMLRPYVFEGLPAWQPAMELKGEALRSLYADDAFRTAVRNDLERTRGSGLFTSEWDKVTIFETALSKNKPFEGRTIAALAAEAGVPELDYLLDFALKDDLRTLFTALLRNTDEAAVTGLINSDEALVALSDAGAHLTFLCDAAFGLHLLGHWARDRAAITLQMAVHKLTGFAAKVFGIPNRGSISPGAFADLMMFDPTRVGRGRNERRFDLPAGGQRERASGHGVRGVWVNGKRVVDESGLIRNAGLNGQVIRNFEA